MPHIPRASAHSVLFQEGFERQVGPQYVVENAVEENFKVRIFREIAFSYALADFAYFCKHVRVVSLMGSAPRKARKVHHPLFVGKMVRELLLKLKINGREPFR